MKLTLIILLLVFYVNNGFSQKQEIKIYNSKFKIPEYLKELSPSQMELFKSRFAIRKQIHVFASSENNKIDKSLIIYYDTLSNNTQMKFDEIVKLKLEITQESNLNFFDIQIDSLNYFVFGNLINKGDTSIYGFSINQFGMLSFQYDAIDGINSKAIKVFENIMKSVKQNNPYFFKANSNIAKRKKEMEDSGLFVTIGLIAMIGIWFIRKYLIKN